MKESENTIMKDNPSKIQYFHKTKVGLMKNIILVLLLIGTSMQSGNSQILGKIFERATDKIADQISDEINDAIYREIEKATVKAVDDATDEMLRERYESDSINGRTSSADYNGFLKAFMIPVDLPANYTFDMVLLADTKDYDGEESKIEFMLTKDGSLIGIRHLSEDNPGLIIIDLTNDVIATYTEEDGKKQVTAMPNMMTFGGAYIKANVKEEDMESTMERTGKTKKIEGYKCEEWRIEDEKTITKAYIAIEFPISWKESHSKFLSYMMPTTQKDKMPNGMALKSESKTKKKNKKSSFVVTKVIDTPTVFDNSEYEQISYNVED
ncbi:MAG: hypothetical protein ACJA1A_000525 [Saprospiraceae bacterium]